jgi:hypothetical protein
MFYQNTTKYVYFILEVTRLGGHHLRFCIRAGLQKHNLNTTGQYTCDMRDILAIAIAVKKLKVFHILSVCL